MAKKRCRRREANILDLPPEVAQLIVSRLDIEDRRAVSLVSKSFLPICNGLVRQICFGKQLPSRVSEFRKKFARFPSATQIRLEGKIGRRALTEIANSDLKIEKLILCEIPHFRNLTRSFSARLGNVKALSFSWYSKWMESKKQVVDFIIHMFQSLEELDLGTRRSIVTWTDAEIVELAKNLPNLRKISFSCDSGITDSSLDALSNCVNLEHISLQGRGEMTLQGFCSFVLRRRKNLKSLDVPRLQFNLGRLEDETQTLANIVCSCEHLCHLSIGRIWFADPFLTAIASSRTTLTSLELPGLEDFFRAPNPMRLGYTMTVLKETLRVCHGLTRLQLVFSWGVPQTDEDMSQWVKFLPHLKVVSLTWERPLYATLFSLIHNCPLLESINMHGLSSNASCDVPQLTRKNYSIQRILLYCPRPDWTLKGTLKSLCPSAKISILVCQVECLDVVKLL